MRALARILAALVLAAFVAALEFVGGTRAGSLALLTDAVHVCMDILALLVALLALIGASRPANARKTFGYGRLEMLGALVNGALLLAAVIVIVFEAVVRFRHPSLPHGAMMTVVAAIALIVNAGVGLLLLPDGRRNLNVRAALYHVAGDAFGAAAVIAGGIVILATHVAWIDPLLSLVVACVIVAGVYRVLRDAADVLLEGTPRGIDVGVVAKSICGVNGVAAVHDLHVWTIGSEERALSAHVQIEDRRVSEAGDVLRAVNARLRDDFGITHATVQLECDRCEPGEGIVCARDLPTAR